MTGYLTSSWTVTLDDACDVLEWLDDQEDYMVTETDESYEVIDHSLTTSFPSTIRVSLDLRSKEALDALENCDVYRLRRIAAHPWSKSFPKAFSAKLQMLLLDFEEEESLEAAAEEQERNEFLRWQEDQYGKGI